MYKCVNILMFLMFLNISPGARAMSDEIQQYLSDPVIVGESRLRFLFWNVYDAALFAPQGNWSAENAFALRLTYLRNLDGEEIAKRSVKEMRRQGIDDDKILEQWLDIMVEVFPDVDDGDVLTGIRAQDGQTFFYYNGERIGHVADPMFATYFFGIWLSDATSEPDLRQELLGVTQ